MASQAVEVAEVAELVAVYEVRTKGQQVPEAEGAEVEVGLRDLSCQGWPDEWIQTTSD
ncbi:hypothetical protein [Candidatus Palauibacter sp.]|uniref:hypothetical protein n=1 Tax=Candidatus Palauibacter sp. TaxID=3101350 RepID=UPI003B026A5A